MSVYLLAALALLVLFGFRLGRSSSLAAVTDHQNELHSRPGHYGYYVALWCGVPAFILFVLWRIVGPSFIDQALVSYAPLDIVEKGDAFVDVFVRDAKALATGDVASRDTPAARAASEVYSNLSAISNWSMVAVVIAIAVAGLSIANSRITPEFRARNSVERFVRSALFVASLIAILTTIGIVASLLFESMRFFQKVSPAEFLFGIQWSPQTALRADQVGSSSAFGAIPLFVGTLLITMIAMTVAAPVGLFAAIYLSDYASKRVRSIAKPLLEILAGVPTVVYGFFAALTVAPVIRGFGEGLGLDVASESALAAGLVMGVMIIPFVSSLSDDVINAVPQSLRDGSLGLGATKSETMRRVILPAALPGIVSALILAFSRAIGETMIVVMAAGLAANLTINPLEAVTTVTVQIVTLLVGDQEFDSAKTLAAFALGLTLFCVTLVLNFIALRIVQRFREQYD